MPAEVIRDLEAAITVLALGVERTGGLTIIGSALEQAGW